MDQQFWMVWCPVGGRPTVTHSTQGSARAEAERLSMANHGRRFFVLKAECFAETFHPTRVVDLSPADGVDLPF